MTKGPCMLGKLNHYLGSRAADEGRAALYPEIDFCKLLTLFIVVSYEVLRILKTFTEYYFVLHRFKARFDMQRISY
jgi:hypothetical protein